MQFNSEVTKSEWDELESKWKVTFQQKLPNGEHFTNHTTCDILLFATGVLNSTKWPEIDGLKEFKGKVEYLQITIYVTRLTSAAYTYLQLARRLSEGTMGQGQNRRVRIRC